MKTHALYIGVFLAFTTIVGAHSVCGQDVAEKSVLLDSKTDLSKILPGDTILGTSATKTGLKIDAKVLTEKAVVTKSQSGKPCLVNILTGKFITSTQAVEDTLTAKDGKQTVVTRQDTLFHAPEQIVRWADRVEFTDKEATVYCGKETLKYPVESVTVFYPERGAK